MPDGLELEFSFPVDEESAKDPGAWQAEMWNYLWSSKYGSDQFSVLTGEKGHDKLAVTKVTLLDDRRVQLTIPQLKVCDQLQLDMKVRNDQDELFVERLYMTIHAIPSMSAGN